MRGPHVDPGYTGIHRDPSHLRPPVGATTDGGSHPTISHYIPLYPGISRHIPAYPGSFFVRGLPGIGSNSARLRDVEGLPIASEVSAWRCQQSGDNGEGQTGSRRAARDIPGLHLADRAKVVRRSKVLAYETMRDIARRMWDKPPFLLGGAQAQHGAVGSEVLNPGYSGTIRDPSR